MQDLLDRLETVPADRYRVEREIGRGDMARVFLTNDPKLDRPAAPKVPSRTSPRCLPRSHPPRSAVRLRRCRAVADRDTGPGRPR